MSRCRSSSATLQWSNNENFRKPKRPSIRPIDWYAQHPSCLAHPVQVAVHHPGRDPVALPGNWREFGDLFVVRPDAVAAVAGAASRRSWSTSSRRDRSRDRIRAARRAAATRFSATRCSRISRPRKPASRASRRIATSAAASVIRARRWAATRSPYPAVIFRCSA